MYNIKKIEECFESNEKWKDIPDEIVRMQMSYKGHSVMMDAVIDEVLKAMENNYGVASIIDIGCGTGMLLTYLEERNKLHRISNYTGYEIVHEFYEKANEKIQKLGVIGEVKKADAFNDIEEKATVVVATQSLNTVYTDKPYLFLEGVIEKMWDVTEGVLVFDLKDIKSPKIYEGRIYYKPEKVLGICRKLTYNVQIKQTTQANFIVIMSREKLF